MSEKPQISFLNRARMCFRSWNDLVHLFLLLASLTALVVVCTANVRLTDKPVASAPVAEVPDAALTPAPAEATPSPEPTPSLPDIDLDSWNMRLVRYEYPLETGFAPELTVVEGEQSFDSRASKNLAALIVNARDAGYGVYVCSLYRSYDTQYEIYWNHVYRYENEGMTLEEAEAATRLAVNYPGASEHQLGLAADLLEFEGQDMEPYIGGSGLMLWMEEHCAEYGFIIRYPDGKTDITGVEYEPWHLRYVGTEAATYIMEHNLCLEEFLALYE